MNSNVVEKNLKKDSTLGKENQVSFNIGSGISELET